MGLTRILESIKQLYYVITTKQLFLEWLLEINLFIGRKLTRSLSAQESNEYVEANESIDMRTAPDRVKRNIIHDEEVLKMRWDICTSCEFLKDNKCEKCGCFMKVKHKLATAKCPEGKWDSYAA
tara:strand:- start:528 stop:899 length:372 start_codon:yes stop_codon:yes gene_type:complete